VDEGRSLRGTRVFLAAPYSQLMDWAEGRVLEHWRTRIEGLRRELIDAGAEVFNAHHNESWGIGWLPPEVCTPTDFRAMGAADVVCAVLGSPPSGGVTVELGWASALAKPVVVILSPGGSHTPLVSGLGAVTPTAYLNEPDRWDSTFFSEVRDALERVSALPAVVPGDEEAHAGYVGRADEQAPAAPRVRARRASVDD